MTIKKKTTHWLSHCPVLDVYSQGSTKEEAKDNLIDALKLFLISCYERGTLDDVLKECDFSLETETDPQIEQDDSSFVKVPIYLLASDNPHSQCRA
jgi:predicted RNase H-like HicB family nuclease